MRMGDTRAGPRGARRGRGGRRASTWRTASSSARRPRGARGVLRGLWSDGVATSVDLLGEATVTAAEADRYAARCADALDDARRRLRRAGPRAAARARRRRARLPRVNLSVKVSALTPLLRPDAPELGRARRRRAAAPAAAPGARRSARTCTSTWSRSTRARRSLELVLELLAEDEFARRPVGRASCCRPTCATRRRCSTRSSTGRASSRARAPADRPARQGRLLGPRGRRGAPARLDAAGVRGQGRQRPQLRGAHARAARRARPRPVRVAIASHNLRSVAHAIAANARSAAATGRPRAPGAARPRRRPRSTRWRATGPPRAHLLPGRRPRRRDGLPRPPAAREHEQRLVPRTSRPRGVPLEELLAAP